VVEHVRVTVLARLMHCSKHSPIQYLVGNCEYAWRIVRPSARAVFILITSSNVVGSRIGTGLGGTE